MLYYIQSFQTFGIVGNDWSEVLELKTCGSEVHIWEAPYMRVLVCF